MYGFRSTIAKFCILLLCQTTKKVCVLLVIYLKKIDGCQRQLPLRKAEVKKGFLQHQKLDRCHNKTQNTTSDLSEGTRSFFSVSKPSLDCLTNNPTNASPTMDRLESATILADLAKLTPANPPLGGGLPTDDWFLRELRKILNEQWNRDIVSWLPEGKIWRVHDLVAFQTIILPRMPVIKDFGSPLDLFLAYTKVMGFQEISRGLNSVAFYHQVRSSFAVTRGQSVIVIYLQLTITCVFLLGLLSRSIAGIFRCTLEGDLHSLCSHHYTDCFGGH